MKTFRPVRFKGTEEERLANRATHHFVSYGEEPPECVDCLARSYHATADYPCGTEAPREVLDDGVDDGIEVHCEPLLKA
jgi:hypothetical protein